MAESAKKEKLSLDEFLTQQTKVQLVGTLEANDSDSKKIKFTPWRPGTGCQCSASIMLPKSAIAAVTPTGDTHYCCGKTLRVVEVELLEGESLPIHDVVQQMLDKASAPSHDEGSGVRGGQVGGVPMMYYADKPMPNSYAQATPTLMGGFDPRTCPVVSQCPWGCCPANKPVACSLNGRCWCCESAGACITGQCQ